MLIHSPIYFGASVRRPVFLFAGEEDLLSRLGCHQFAAQAVKAKCDVMLVPGDHNSCKPEAIEQIVALLKEIKPK